MALQLAMKKYFPSVEKFYSVVATAEKNTTSFIHSMHKKMIEGKSSKETGEFEGMAS